MGPHRSPKTYSFHLPFLRALLPLSLCILSPLPITHAQGEEKTVAITPRTYSDNASGAQNQNTPVGADTLTPGCQSAPYKGSRVCTCPQPFGSAAWAKKTCQDGAGKLWAAGTKRCSKASDAVYTCVPPRGWTRGGTLSGQNICISLNAVGRGTSMCPYYGTVKIESRTPVPPSPPTPQPPPAPVPPPPAPVPPKPTTTVQPPPPPPAPTPPPTPAPVPPPYNPPTPTKSKKPKFVAGGAEVTNLLQPQPTGLGIAVPADPPGDEGPPSVLHGNISRLVVPRKLLFVLTNVNELGNTGVPTGWYLPEIARPYYYFQTAGVQMTFASPSGGNTWIDPLSIVWFAREKQCGRLLGDKEALQKMNNTVSLDDVNPEEYDAVFYAGGNGVMWDVATSPRLAEITRVIYEKGGIVSAVCHGSAGLAMVTLSNGEFLVKGKTLTGLSNNEEAISGMSGVVPFLLEDTLEEVGANYKWRPAWETHVEIDESGRLITGQNYASSSETAIWVISALRTLPDPPGFDARTQGQGSSVTEALGDVPKGFEIQLPKEPPGDEVPPSVSLKNMARLEVPRRLLFVVTNHKELGNTGGTTGWYLPEIARPYYYFLQAGINMTVASPQGGDTPIDPLSLLWFANRDLNARFMADEEAKKLFQNTVPLSRINPNEYDAVFYAGGNGVMWDVATDPRLAQFSKVIYEKGGVIGAVCHGSAGLALIKLSNGEYLVKNRKVTGLTNNEETIASMNKVMPFLLEDKLKEIGANFIWRPEWTTHVEVSGRVISGQNYASSTETAIAIIGALRTLPDPPGFNPATQSQGSSVTDKLDNVPQGFAVELPKDPPGDEAPPTMPLDQVPKLTIPRNLLFVVTGWEDLGKTGGKTGWYLPEIARPYYHFEKAGINLTIASVPGGKTPVDPLSVIWFEREERCGRFLRDPVAMRRMNNTVPLSRINPLDYDGIFYAGGNGVMWDVAINTRLPTIAKTIYERGGVVSSVCHGSAALALIKLSNGEYLVKGKEVTGLTNNEETIPGMQRVVPFLLEDKLKSVGADFNWKPEWVTHVEVSDYGRVISGQNYASSTETAVQVIKAFQSLPKVELIVKGSGMEALKKSGLLALPLCMVFVTTGVFVNTMQLVLYACVGWWNHNLFRTINAQLVTLNWSLFVWLADWYAGLKLRLFGDPKAWEMVGKDRALCLVNHTSDIDWLMGWMIAERFHMLGGTKAFMKESAKYYPILGWTWHFCEFIWLKRSWDSDKKTIDSGLRQLQDYPLPYWAVLFPEGTRWTPKKHLASQQFSREKGLPVLEHLLTPRPKGFVFAVKCLRQDIDAMYICTFAFKDKKAPTMLSILKGESTEVHAYCQKFDPKSLPEDDKGLTEWLNAHFIEMDKLLTYHDQHHIYPGPETFQNVTNRPMYITMFWFVVHALFLVWWIYSSIVTGNYAGLQRLGIFTLATAVILGILLKVSAADKTKVAKPVDGKGAAASKEEKKEK